MLQNKWQEDDMLHLFDLTEKPHWKPRYPQLNLQLCKHVCVCVCLLYFLGPTCFQWENLMLIIVKRFGFVLIRWPNGWVKSNFPIWWFWHQLLGPCFWSWFEWYIHPGGWKTQYFLYQQSKEGRSLSWLSSDVDPTSGWPLTSWTIGYRKWLDLPTKPLKTLL